MVSFFNLNRTPILNILKLLLLIFGIFALIIIVVAYFQKGIIIVKYPLIFTISTSLFCTATVFFLEYLRSIKENKFFKKSPYNLIQNKTLETNYIQESKYDFFKKHRIFKLDDIKYTAIFYSDIVRNPFGNSLVIIKEINEEEKSIFHIIDYKRQHFDEFSLVNELNKICKS